MALFGRGQPETRSLNNPTIPLSSPGIISILGGALSTNSGVSVSEFTAMKMAAVWRCVTLIAGTIAQLPLQTFVDAGGGERQTTENPLLSSPHPDLTDFEFWEQVLTHMLLWGNAYILKIPNVAGDAIVRLLPLQPWSVGVARTNSPNGSQYGAKVFSVYGMGGTPITRPGESLTDAEIMHIPGLGYDGIQGLSPIAHARESIGLGMAAEEMGARLFGSGSLMGGVLQTDQKLLQEQAEAVKLRWRERISGLARAHEIAVLDAGVKFVPISITPEDSQFIQSRAFSVNEICRFYGVPPHLVADVEKSTSWGTGVAEQSLGFVRYTLGFWMRRIEKRVSKELLPPGQIAEFNADAILRGDTTARYAAYSVAMASGWMSGNEVRRKENLPGAGPALDVYGPPPMMPPPIPLGGKDPNGA